MSRRITITLIGSKDDGNDVRLSDFLSQLANVKRALRETEISISGGADTLIDYKVVDLRRTRVIRAKYCWLSIGQRNGGGAGATRLYRVRSTRYRILAPAPGLPGAGRDHSRAVGGEVIG